MIVSSSKCYNVNSNVTRGIISHESHKIIVNLGFGMFHVTDLLSFDLLFYLEGCQFTKIIRPFLRLSRDEENGRCNW